MMNPWLLLIIVNYSGMWMLTFLIFPIGHRCLLINNIKIKVMENIVLRIHWHVWLPEMEAAHQTGLYRGTNIDISNVVILHWLAGNLN